MGLRSLLARLRYRYRSSITGRWVSKHDADEHSDTTVRETGSPPNAE
jgi:hypothetical protein